MRAQFFAGACAALLVLANRDELSAQQAPAGARRARRIVEGRVQLGRATGERPLGNQLVVLHRIASAGSGPVDSARTSRDGSYRLTFPSTPDSAMFIVSASYGGVAYFTAPLRGDVVPGSDAEIVVFDTTSRAPLLVVSGRHLVVAGPGDRGARRMTEVFEISNDSSVTRIASETSPSFTVRLPPGARDAQVGQGDVPAGAVRFDGTTAKVFAPFPPGLKQLVVSYEVGRDAFPMSVPVSGASVLEVLLEEPSARLDGVRLERQAPVTIGGRAYQRFLGRDVPAGAVLRVVAVGAATPSIAGRVALLAIAAVVAALGFLSSRRRRPVDLVASGAPQTVAALVNAVAAIDNLREAGRADGAVEHPFDERRAVLKAQLVAALSAVAPEDTAR